MYSIFSLRRPRATTTLIGRRMPSPTRHRTARNISHSTVQRTKCAAFNYYLIPPYRPSSEKHRFTAQYLHADHAAHSRRPPVTEQMSLFVIIAPRPRRRRSSAAPTHILIVATGLMRIRTHSAFIHRAGVIFTRPSSSLFTRVITHACQTPPRRHVIRHLRAPDMQPATPRHARRSDRTPRNTTNATRRRLYADSVKTCHSPPVHLAEDYHYHLFIDYVCFKTCSLFPTPTPLA